MKLSISRRWLRLSLGCLGGVGGLALVTWLGMVGLMSLWVARPPAIPADAPILKESLRNQGARVWLGRSWFERREGLQVVCLRGNAFELGYANGALTRELIGRQEEALLQLLNRVAPWGWTQFALKFVVTWKNRGLADAFLEEHRFEILGLSKGCPDAHPEVGPYYHRLLNYHAAQDISYMMMNSPLLRGGCTAFGAWGPHTQNRHLLLGRNFDWEAARVFDEDRLLILCEPDHGIPFASLAWAGMAGCVSAMNREGLAITANGAPSRLPRGAATPTCMVAREVVQHARDIAGAVDILQRRHIFVSAMFLVGSRRDGRCVIVEKTPEKTVVRDSGESPFIVCANHYFTHDLTNDPVNLEYVEADTSPSRYARMEELLKRSKGELEVRKAAAILRDRMLPGDRPAGNGHRGTLNPLIATHAVLMDLSAGLFWAATSPHQLGRFVAVDLADFERTLPGETIPADSMLAGREFERYLEAQQRLEQGFEALRRGSPSEALARASEAEEKNPGFYRNAWLRAGSLLAAGRQQEAIQAAQGALAGQPAFASERRGLNELIERAKGGAK